MRTPVYTARFKKDLKRMQARGVELENIKAVVRDLVEGIPLAPRYRDHVLIGNFKDRCEFHIEAGWLLIYRIDVFHIIFERTGSHADLFKYRTDSIARKGGF